ncbi:MAG: sigma-E factor regulatory protein RseB domain-containing protein [Candidatus Omnitrophota bacterium]
MGGGNMGPGGMGGGNMGPGGMGGGNMGSRQVSQKQEAKWPANNKKDPKPNAEEKNWFENLKTWVAGIRGSAKINYIESNGDFEYKKGVGLIVLTDRDVDYEIRIVTKDSDLCYRYNSNIIFKSDIKGMREEFGEEYSVFFDPENNFLLTKPFSFSKLMDFHPVSWGTEDLNGRQCYVFQMKKTDNAVRYMLNILREISFADSVTAKVWIDTQTGLLMQYEIYDKDSALQESFKVVELNVDSAISDDDFKLELPETIPVINDDQALRRDIRLLKYRLAPEAFAFDYNKE